MRFVQAFTRADTGELVAITESEVPITPAVGVSHMFRIDKPTEIIDLHMHELGLAEHFDAVDSDTGKRCAPSWHLFQRMERVPHASAADRTVRFRAKPGHEAEVPAFHDVPTTIEAIREAVRVKGPSAIPERAAHWLDYMEALSEAEMEAAGLPRITAEIATEFDSMRTKRDPAVGARAYVFKRRIEERERIKSIKAANTPERLAEGRAHRAAQAAGELEHCRALLPQQTNETSRESVKKAIGELEREIAAIEAAERAYQASKGSPAPR